MKLDRKGEGRTESGTQLKATVPAEVAWAYYENTLALAACLRMALQVAQREHIADVARTMLPLHWISRAVTALEDAAERAAENLPC